MYLIDAIVEVYRFNISSRKVHFLMPQLWIDTTIDIKYPLYLGDVFW